MVKIFEGPVWLEPIKHQYHHRYTKKIYSSVTQTLHSLVNVFDSDAVSTAISKQPENKRKPEYVGLSKQQILDYWQFLNDEANEYGTMVHEMIEEYLLKDKFLFPKDPLHQTVIQAYDDLNVDEGECMWPERIMFSEEHELAGTADLIIDIDETFFDVGDWKGLPVDTPIFTNNGWKTMGTLSHEDKVYDMNGNLTKILHLSSVKNKPCYKITFDNNETIVADFEHRWLISFLRDKKFKDVVMTTEELSNYLNELNNSGKRWSQKLPKIKIAKPLNNESIELPIDPYVLGIWLGDGHSADSKVTNMHEDVWDELTRRGCVVGDDVSQGGCGKATTRTLFGMRSELRELGLLYNKHLPDIYLQASYEQRLDVLRGFMDADGHYNESRKRFVMSTTRESQALSFNTLISSLGIKGTFLSYRKKANGKMIDAYDICFSTDGLNPFLCRNQEGIEYGKQNNRTFKNVISVEKVDSIPTRCIEVESETHTFLYGHTFSITHNTNRVFNYFDDFGFKTLKKPLEHLQDCHYSHYSVQLSIYAYMYELETGRKCRQIWIGYWDKKLETLVKIPIMYLKHEAKKVLDLHKFNKQFAI